MGLEDSAHPTRTTTFRSNRQKLQSLPSLRRRSARWRWPNCGTLTNCAVYACNSLPAARRDVANTPLSLDLMGNGRKNLPASSGINESDNEWMFRAGGMRAKFTSVREMLGANCRLRIADCRFASKGLFFSSIGNLKSAICNHESLVDSCAFWP